MQEYVLNLSISLRTGEETNLDFFSSGERTRKSSNGNCSCVREDSRILWKEEHYVVIAHGRAEKRKSSIVWECSMKRWYKHLKLNIMWRPIAKKYREGKLKIII